LFVMRSRIAILALAAATVIEAVDKVLRIQVSPNVLVSKAPRIWSAPYISRKPRTPYTPYIPV
jgi:hypothetical protein